MDHYDNAVFTFRGAGKLYFGPVGGTALYFAGLVTAFAFETDVDSGDLADLTNPAGGVYRHYDRVKSAKLTGSLAELKPMNAAAMTLGAESEVATGSVAAEAITVALGALVPTAHPIDTTASVTVSGGAIEGTDYVVAGAGIVFLPGSTLVNGSAKTVTYTKAAAWKVEVAAGSQTIWRIIFDGYNADDNDRRLLAEFYRARVAPGSIAFLTDGYWSGALSATLEADTTKTGAGISKYGKILYYQG